MKDSFTSMQGINVHKWIVNVRGSKASDVVSYFKYEEKVEVYTIESLKGWFYDSQQLYGFIESNYLFLWIEDHLCMANDKIMKIVDEMDIVGADILTYTFWNFGDFRKRYNNIEPTIGTEIDYFIHTEENNKFVQSNKLSYIISYPSIIKKELYKKIVFDGEDKGGWDPKTPFNFEKQPQDTKWLPLKRALPKYELFASIDDDHGTPGVSLQSRGLYPIREERKSYALSTGNKGKGLPKKIVNFFFSKIPYKGAKPLIYRIYKNTSETLKNSSHVPFKYKWSYYCSVVFPISSVDQVVPWFNYKAIIFINKRLKHGFQIFEYGSGGPTLYWLKHQAQLVSIEHDPDFYNFMKDKVRTNASVDYRLIEPIIEKDTECDPSNPDLFHSSDYKSYSFKKYCDVINEYPNEYFDIILVDGRARTSCVKYAVEKVKKGGMLILDNSNREWYLENTRKYLDGFDEHIFVGFVPGLLHQEQTSIFIRNW
jgi:hypothetical protein